MINKQLWGQFWEQLQFDTADTLQNTIFNFSTLVAIIAAMIKVFYPEYDKLANDLMLAYLAVLPKVKP